MPNNLKEVLSALHSPTDATLLGPKMPKDLEKKTLVIDLDETLVHSSFKPIPRPDIVLEVEIENNAC